MELPKCKLLIEEVEIGGGIINDNNGNNIVFDHVKDATDYIHKMHPIWTDGLTKEESRATYVVYDKRMPMRDLRTIRF